MDKYKCVLMYKMCYLNGCSFQKISQITEECTTCKKQQFNYLGVIICHCLLLTVVNVNNCWHQYREVLLSVCLSFVQLMGY